MDNISAATNLSEVGNQFPYLKPLGTYFKKIKIHENSKSGFDPLTKKERMLVEQFRTSGLNKGDERYMTVHVVWQVHVVLKVHVVL